MFSISQKGGIMELTQREQQLIDIKKKIKFIEIQEGRLRGGLNKKEILTTLYDRSFDLSNAIIRYRKEVIAEYLAMKEEA